MLFDFYLRPIEEVQPWGKPPNLSLSWFGFTDGFYHLQVGSEFLFNYSSEFVKHQPQQLPDPYRGFFVDYYVARLWEDILDMLPEILEPVPVELFSFFEKDKTTWFEWEDLAFSWLDNQPDENETVETFEQIISWQRTRKVDAAYLQNAPRVWIWSTAHNVIISWDNTEIELDGIQIWSARQGHYYLKRDEFLSEVYSFHNRFMDAMAERVEMICDRWDKPTVYVDIASLKVEQQKRETWLEGALKKTSSTSWDSVLSAKSTTSGYFAEKLRE